MRGIKVSVDEQVITRLLSERETARNDGDKLAVAVAAFLAATANRSSVSEKTKKALRQALKSYVKGQKWNGPAGGWCGKISGKM